jgi:hypothetical protein
MKPREEYLRQYQPKGNYLETFQISDTHQYGEMLRLQFKNNTPSDSYYLSLVWMYLELKYI